MFDWLKKIVNWFRPSRIDLKDEVKAVDGALDKVVDAIDSAERKADNFVDKVHEEVEDGAEWVQKKVSKARRKRSTKKK